MTASSPAPSASRTPVLRQTAAFRALHQHWPEYLMEAAGLGLFMFSACTFALIVAHPLSPVPGWVTSTWMRRALMGAAMGLTATALVYSPWGQQSGAHLNPSITLTYFRLGRVAAWDLAFYCLFQLAGGIGSMLLLSAVAAPLLSHPAINYVATIPGEAGPATAFAAEFVISFVLMLVILSVTSSRFARWAGLCAGLLVTLNICLVGPLSGMSMNPARSLASALPAQIWQGIWIYVTAPPLAMLLAAQVHLSIYGRRSVSCAKLHHQNQKRCIFCEHHAHR